MFNAWTLFMHACVHVHCALSTPIKEPTIGVCLLQCSHGWLLAVHLDYWNALNCYEMCHWRLHANVIMCSITVPNPAQLCSSPQLAVVFHPIPCPVLCFPTSSVHQPCAGGEWLSANNTQHHCKHTQTLHQAARCPTYRCPFFHLHWALKEIGAVAENAENRWIWRQSGACQCAGSLFASLEIVGIPDGKNSHIRELLSTLFVLANPQTLEQLPLHWRRNTQCTDEGGRMSVVCLQILNFSPLHTICTNVRVEHRWRGIIS